MREKPLGMWPSVFVSSTSEDLADYRAAARDVCQKLGMAVIDMESFPAMGYRATEGSLLRLDDAHVYVGIAAYRYGFIGEGHERSVTHEEHRYAGTRGLERLCFVLNPDHPWPRSKCDRDLSRVEAFRAEIQQEIRAEFTTVEDFALKLTTALVAWRDRTMPESRCDASGDLDQQKEILRLQWLCERLPLHVLLECYRGAVGQAMLLDGLTDAGRIVDKLIDATTGSKTTVAMLEFGMWLEHRAGTESLRGRAAAWTDTAAQRRSFTSDDLADLRAGVGERAASRRVPDRMVIRLDESYGSVARYALSVVLHRGNGVIDPLVAAGDDQVCSVGEIREVVADSIFGWARTCDPTGLVIEFLVPLRLVGEPFDQWPAEEPDGGGTTPLCVRYGVLVRDLQRAEEEPSDLWRRRWELLQTSRGSGASLRWVPAAVAEMGALWAELDGDWACVAFERFSDDDTSRRFVSAGIDLGAPAILWVRTDAAEVAPPSDLQRELSTTPLPGLPAKLFALRRDAARRGWPADHCGGSLGLLWHDPDHQRSTVGLLAAPTVEGD